MASIGEILYMPLIDAERYCAALCRIMSDLEPHPTNGDISSTRPLITAPSFARNNPR